MSNAIKLRNASIVAIPTVVLIVMSLINSAQAQWTNRYPKVEGFSHHVYVEGYELPILSSGPVDPAASPDGDRIAFAAYGWIWILNSQTGVASRLTNGDAVDSRPTWSPDGRKLAFVRDNLSDLAIIVRNLDTGEDRVIDTETMDLDPAFSPDGKVLYYASGKNGTVDIWRTVLDTGIQSPVTSRQGIERSPKVTADGLGLVYLHSPETSKKTIWYRSLVDGTERPLKTTSIAGQAAFDLHPEERAMVFAWPQVTDWQILVADLDDPVPAAERVTENGLPMMPAWSSDGSQLYFVRVDERQQFSLHVIPSVGGAPRPVTIEQWNWGTDVGRVEIRTLDAESGNAIPARLSVSTENGHPLTSPHGATYFDPQNGRHYFYSDGTISLPVPAGKISVTAVHGLMTEPVTVTIDVDSNAESAVDIPLRTIWDAEAAGWKSADFHFHLNYDGFYRMKPSDIYPLMDGENLDIGTPLAANLHNRLQDRAFRAHQSRSPGGGLVRFGQEVRAHFHGHLGVVGVDEFYNPWFWGHFYPSYGTTNLSNASVHAFSRAHNGMTSYVHPISAQGDAFSEDNIDDIPLELVSDGVLGDIEGIEVVCAWSDELATASIWYRLLNIGVPVAASAGTDMFVDFHRTPAIGVSRTYVRQNGAPDWESYLAGLKSGRSFVTNAPALIFSVDETRPGDSVDGGREANWRLELASAIPVEQVEILVNGEIVWNADGLAAAGSTEFTGSIELPEGGWIAARAHGGQTAWPAMDSYPFAHSSPIWIGEVGSVDPAARDAARADLLRALDSAERRAAENYEDVNVSILRSRLREARQALQE